MPRPAFSNLAELLLSSHMYMMYHSPSPFLWTCPTCTTVHCTFTTLHLLARPSPALLTSSAWSSLTTVRGNRREEISITSTITTIIIFIITRPKPAYGRQGLAGSWGQDTDKVSTFWVFLTSHFAPAALSSELNQPGTIHDDTNPLGIMKTRPGAIKKHEKQTWNHEKPTWNHGKP